VDPNSLLRPKGVDQINLFKLVQYIQDSKLAYKIESYAAHVEEEGNPTTQPSKSATPVLHALLSFLIALTNLSSEGRIFFQKIPGPPSDIQLSYLLLSPTHAFSSIASKARAVILAGGTMSPFDDYKAHLFPSLPESKITTLSCGHVIPPSNLCVWTLGGTRSKGAGGNMEFEFNFQRRGDRTMVHQLGLSILNICSVVPDGVVVFFPSYGYLDEVIAVWQGLVPPDTKSIWDRIQARKQICRETRGGSSDETLQEYSAVILGDGSAQNSRGARPTKPRGAILLSVVGGKMSEGINFSDRLGRCVIIVGLPYPNINSPEWKAKTEYIESSTLSRLTAPASSDSSTDKLKPLAKDEAVTRSKQAARDFYENACMRAVNQSIGRAIRHKEDYAAIVLVDRRYGAGRICRKLPGWIQSAMVASSEEKGVPQLMAALSEFFRGKIKSES
jgi:chromosome transmission fidelity protein 1